MTHQLAFVVIPGDGDVQALVDEVMAPWDLNLDVEKTMDEDSGEMYWHNPRGFWDFWQIGGRWTGLWSGYNPRLDPERLERCIICGGSGWRDDDIAHQHRAAHPEYTCNGCSGVGMRVSWPTEWPVHDGDIQEAWQIADSPLERAPYTLLTHGAESIHHREEFRFVPEDPSASSHVELMDEDDMRRLIRLTVNARSKAGLVGDRIVVVDYHR